VNHGDQFCAAIENGLTERADIDMTGLPAFISNPDAGAASAA